VRQSSLVNEDRQMKSLARKDTFNDPFLGRGRTPYKPSTQPNSLGLLDPLISLPPSGRVSNYRPELSEYVQAKAKYPEINYQEPAVVSYPRARSKSPEIIPSPVDHDFTKRFPSLESFDIQNSSTPPPPIPVKTQLSSTEIRSFPPLPNIQARDELYKPYQPPVLQDYRSVPQYQSPPSIPLKPTLSTSRMPSETLMTPPPIAPKPGYFLV
jgi:hypothetical protein